MRVSSQVPAGTQAVSVVAYLAARFTYLGEEAWCELVANGRVWRNETLCEPQTLVQSGDLVTCALPDFPIPAVNLDYTIAYEDAWLLGINKPPNLRVHSRGKFVTANLIYHLRHRCQPPYPEAQLVNRLDADTSGVVLVARSPAVKQALAAQFAAGAVQKQYLAVVTGVPDPPAGVINQPLGRVAGSLLPQRQGVMAGGKTAVTHYKTIATYQNAFSLLALRPQTGRTHQLRVHLAHLGHPILGDALYTMSDAEFLHWVNDPHPLPEMQGMTRQALHCQEMRFTHPISGQECAITAPLPNDIQALLGRLAGEV